ncbi:carboxypeptidase-like regulatory domain-containing protein [Promicromonospora sp. NPDC059942]|uniref:carboxypeptidase-like regulatory domain-containing protein n=1 Tax=Promicromonospora sp. NPDC059942 TaxID=3347009 RepID=UPI00365DA265
MSTIEFDPPEGTERTLHESTMRMRARAGLAAILAFLAALIMGGLPATAAEPISGSISGVVHEEFELPAHPVLVTVRLAGEGTIAGTTTTAADGTFAVGELTPGERYTIEMTNADGTPRYVPGEVWVRDGEYYVDTDDVASLPAFELPEAGLWMDVRIERAGGISGNVLDQQGAPVWGVRVKVAAADGRVVAQHGLADGTGPDGEFSFSHVRPGENYTLEIVRAATTQGFAFGYVGERQATQDRAQAKRFTVPIAGLSGQQVVLPRLTTITGTVVAPDGSPVAYTEVAADPIGYGAHGSTTTAEDGSFSLEAAGGDTGEVFVSANRQLGFSPYTGVYYAGAGSTANKLADATPLAVEPGGNLTGVNFGLSECGAVEGTVTHLPAYGSRVVRVFNDDDLDLVTRHVEITEDGAFRVPGLAPGTYDVSVAVTEEGGASESWFRYGAPNAEEAADIVVPESCDTVAGIDFALGEHEVHVLTSPTVSGSTKMGETVEANPGTWTPGYLTHAYRWLRDGVAIEDATSPRYTITTGDLDSKLSVEVTSVRDGFTDGVATSPERTVKR